MVIGLCVVELSLEGCRSLKEKRSLIKPILARLPKEFNLAVAEVGGQDAWAAAEIALVSVSAGDTGKMHGLLEHAADWLETHFPDVEVVGTRIELL
ncbi:MAG TPA: DUF503 domain-containing protein [Anaerolineales bacterium]|nr:DUF503 domain-containing protein [Anaerolineales bacterium]